MKPAPAYLSFDSLLEDTSSGEVAEWTLEEAESDHPLVDELRLALDHREATSFGDYARLVEQLLGELSLMSRHIGWGERSRTGIWAERPYIPMTEDEEQRLVDYFAAHGAFASKAR